MRRPKVHRLNSMVILDELPGEPRSHFVQFYTRCGIVGGSELLNLNGVNNGSGHWCSECWPGATPIRRQRPVPDGRWW